MEKVVLAYSGGLDTSVILKWLANKGYEVIAYVGDVGQKDDFEAVRRKAISTGASKVHVKDLKREFVTDFIFPALQASAIYEGRYLLGTAIARPIIAKGQVEVAREEGAQYVAHGATGKGNDQIRFEFTCAALEPSLKTISPWKMRDFLTEFQGRDDMIAYAEKHGIPISATLKAPYSSDANLMHISYEAGILEDPKAAPPDGIFEMTTDPEKAPDTPVALAISFEEGKPVKVTNLDTGHFETDPLQLLVYLNRIGGEHGVGRVDMVENRHIGLKSRGVYESPGATILWKAHEDLEPLTLDREVFRIKQSLSLKVAELIYYGYWYAPEGEFLRRVIAESQRHVSGTVFLKLYKGNITIYGRESENSLYNEDLASMHKEGDFNQEDSRGFINVNSTRLKMYGALKRKLGEDYA